MLPDAITNAELIARAETTASGDLVARFMSMGAERARAERLSRVVRFRRKAPFIVRPAIAIVVVAAVWIAWALSLALRGAADTPGQREMMWPAIAAIAAGVTLAIARAAQLTTGVEWERADRVPRELASPPRDAVVPRMPLASVVGASLVAMIVGVTGIAVPRVRDAEWLKRYGFETRGHVVSREIVNSGRSRAHTVRYAYGSGPLHYQTRAVVTRSEYAAMTPGTEVPVTYDPFHPLVSEPRAHAQLRGGWAILAPMLLPSFVIFGCVALLLIVVADSAQKQTYALATRGVATLARVLRATRGSLQYEYDTPHGQVQARTSFGRRRMPAAPAAGETFVVFYDPENVRRSLPLAAMQDVRFAASR